MFEKRNLALTISAFVLGALTSLGFNGAGQVWFGFLGLFGFGYLFAKGVSRILITGSYAFGYFLSLLFWIRVVGTDAWIGLSLLLSGFWLVSAFVIRIFRVATAVGYATIFTGMELLRDRFPWGGFGWGQFGVWAVDVPILSGLVPFLGQSLVTWIIFFLAFSFWINRRQFGTALIVIFSAGIALNFWIFKTEIQEPLQIGAVQGGVVNYGLGTSGPAGVVFAKHVTATKENLDDLQGSDLIVWPESAVDQRLDSAAITELQELSAQLNSPILVNAVEELSADSVGNHSYVIEEDSSTFVYAKQRLVPFGEFMPLRSLIESFTERADLMPRDFVAGKAAQPTNFDLPLVICFEIADDQIAARQTTNQIILVQTNNATYQNTSQSEQQLLMSRFRALELQTPVLTIATSGVSAYIDRAGNVVQKIDAGAESTIVASTDGKVVTTLARSLNQVVPWGFLVGALAVIFKARKVRP